MTASCFLEHFIQGKVYYTEPQIYPEEVWNIKCIKSDFTDFINCSKRLTMHGTMKWLYTSWKREVNTVDSQNGRMQELKYWIDICPILHPDMTVRLSSVWRCFILTPLGDDGVSKSTIRKSLYFSIGKIQKFSSHFSHKYHLQKPTSFFLLAIISLPLLHFLTHSPFSFLSHPVLLYLNQVIPVKNATLATCFWILTWW